MVEAPLHTISDTGIVVLQFFLTVLLWLLLIAGIWCIWWFVKHITSDGR